mmetsp:Transcript_14405/g.34702  ORF Transcript_14405/g.34702 Transcript_14405/m.34702 type:complete len:269 (-) Transcript_14405:157-963(-)
MLTDALASVFFFSAASLRLLKSLSCLASSATSASAAAAVAAAVPSMASSALMVELLDGGGTEEGVQTVEGVQASFAAAGGAFVGAGGACAVAVAAAINDSFAAGGGGGDASDATSAAASAFFLSPPPLRKPLKSSKSPRHRTPERDDAPTAEAPFAAPPHLLRLSLGDVEATWRPPRKAAAGLGTWRFPVRSRLGCWRDAAEAEAATTTLLLRACAPVGSDAAARRCGAAPLAPPPPTAMAPLLLSAPTAKDILKVVAATIRHKLWVT